MPDAIFVRGKHFSSVSLSLYDQEERIYRSKTLVPQGFYWTVWEQLLICQYNLTSPCHLQR
jgi:hypothetical protein